MQMSNQIEQLSEIINDSETLIIGAGAGLSSSAGYEYSGARFDEYFSDFEKLFGFNDMYSGGFYPYPDLETYWSFWSRAIFLNRYAPIPKSTYDRLLKLMKNKDYFIITTNVDHCFQRAGFDKNRLYYMQGDYGLLQCSLPCHQRTYDNENRIRQMLESQGFSINSNHELVKTRQKIKTKIDPLLIPKCPICGTPMTTNLRIDSKFVEDSGLLKAKDNFNYYIKSHSGKKVLLLELGVGFNTPGIIKYPFWKYSKENDNWKLVCINNLHAYVPDSIKEESICIKKDIHDLICELHT